MQRLSKLLHIHHEKEPPSLKIITVGSYGVGKSTFASLLLGHKLTDKCGHQSMKLPVGDHTVNLVVFDSAGQERVGEFPLTYYDKTDLVVAIVSPDSIDSVVDARLYLNRAMEISASDHRRQPSVLIVVNTRGRRSAVDIDTRALCLQFDIAAVCVDLGHAAVADIRAMAADVLCRCMCD